MGTGSDDGYDDLSLRAAGVAGKPHRSCARAAELKWATVSWRAIIAEQSKCGA
jgi:hypothetical protein